MKKLGYIILIVAVSFSGYLVWSYFASTASDTLIVPAGQADNKNPSVLGANIKNFQDDFLGSAKKKIEEAKIFIENIPQAANDIFNDFIDKTKDTAKEKIITILEATSSLASVPISGNPGIVAGAPQDLSAQPRVCSIVSKGESVGYGIDQPFGDGQKVSYKIAWGDGQSASGLFASGEQRIVVSHSYSVAGVYSVVFEVMSSSTSFTTSRSVCVK